MIFTSLLSLPTRNKQDKCVKYRINLVFIHRSNSNINNNNNNNNNNKNNNNNSSNNNKNDDDENKDNKIYINKIT